MSSRRSARLRRHRTLYDGNLKLERTNSELEFLDRVLKAFESANSADAAAEVGSAAACGVAELGEGVQFETATSPEIRTLIPDLCRLLSNDAEALSPPANRSMPAFDAGEAAAFSRRSAAVLQRLPTDVIRAELEREFDPDLCQRLVCVMGCREESVGEAAFRVVRALGSLAADQVLQALRDEVAHASYHDFTSDARATRLLWLLVQCGDPRVTDVLLEALTPQPPAFRGLGFHSLAIKTLGEMRAARAALVLTGYLMFHPKELRLLAARSLGQIGHRSALPALQRLLSFGIIWGDPVIFTYELDSEVRAVVREAVALIEQTSPDIADCPIPAMPPSDLEDASLPRPVE